MLSLMTKPQGMRGVNQHTAEIDSVVAELTHFTSENETTAVSLSSAESDPGGLTRVANPQDGPVANPPRVKTSVPAQVWASDLAARKRYHELALIFRPDSYHARTDTAEEKRRLAKQSLLAAGSSAVDALLDMLVERDAANTEIAELLIQIDDAKAALLLQQLYETDKFRHREPRGIVTFIKRHLGE